MVEEYRYKANLKTLAMDTILQILQWAIPSGGIGAAIAWIVNHRVKTVENKKKVEDTYKQMYDMVSAELVELQKKSTDNYAKMEELRLENDKTRRALNRLSRAIEAIQLCPHRGECPVSRELQNETTSSGKRRAGKRLAIHPKQPSPRASSPDGDYPGVAASDGGDGDGGSSDNEPP